MTDLEFETIKNFIEANEVVLFMKGNQDFPMCGFSGQVVEILKRTGVTFVSVDILEDQELRENIKIFSKWPTIPQLYIKGKFIGGCDIVTELYKSGELIKLLQG